MAARIALFAAPTAAVVGMVLFLNWIDASAGVAVAALGVVAVMGGGALGLFADRLPELPRTLRARRIAGTHRGD